MEQQQKTSVPTVSGEMAGGNVVDTLLRDHEQIRGLLDGLDRASSAQAAVPIIERLKGILTIHNATEETIVYPALAKFAGEMFEPRKLYFETAEADVLLFDITNIAKGNKEGDFGARCSKFTTAVRKHMETEEQHAFPHLQEKSDDKELANLGPAVREFRSKLRFEGVTA
ncbi:MAG TPA: hemerythrin domain-containing protein [Candidatus Acidoferrum sp.]|nr:hemerythrin domain-containing protein [Candidatus Acidoferrum sp.]